MITKNKINIYKKYDGDTDYWVRSGSKKEHIEMSDTDWNLLSVFLLEIALLQKNQTSSDFNDKLIGKLQASCDNEETFQLLLNVKLHILG